MPNHPNGRHSSRRSHGGNSHRNDRDDRASVSMMRRPDGSIESTVTSQPSTMTVDDITARMAGFQTQLATLQAQTASVPAYQRIAWDQGIEQLQIMVRDCENEIARLSQSENGVYSTTGGTGMITYDPNDRQSYAESPASNAQGGYWALGPDGQYYWYGPQNQ